MDNQKIDQILAELYQIDPELKKEEALARKILMDLYSVRPNIMADPEFIMSLRTQIIDKANQISHRPISAYSYYQFWHSKFALAGLGVVLLVLAPIIYISINQANKPSSDNTSVAINTLNENAFGPLTYQAISGGRGGGGGGGGIAMNMAAPVSSDSSTKEMSASAPLIYPGPEYTINEYIYEGVEFDLSATGMVYKRRAGMISASTIISSLKNLPISAIKNPLVSDINIFEDRDLGYNIMISLKEGYISYYQNWERWPMQDTPCSSEECYARDYLTKSQIPPDDKIISISDSFLAEYGINMSSYGPGEVIKPWGYGPMPLAVQSPEKSSVMYSPDIAIIYPLIIEGKKVYDEWGSLVGINTSVNLKFNRVSAASNISINGYDKSRYDLITDPGKVLEIAKNGGMGGDYYVMAEGGNKVQIKMGTPEIVYMQFYMYKGGKSELMYVPALKFPITDIPVTSSFYKENVIVPLIPDIIDQIQKSRILPAGGGYGGNSGSGTIEPAQPMPAPDNTYPAPETKTIY